MTIYDISFFVFSITYLPYLVLKGKAHRDFAQRLGRLPGIFREVGASAPVWIHAVSVGEVVAAKNVIERLSGRFPERKIVLSTTTKTGNAVARKILGEDILKFYFPLDFSFIIRRVTSLINPSILILMETEIWPNLILELSKRKVPIALLNGRISEGSFKWYRKIKPFFKDILERIDLFCMQTEGDAERIEALGALKRNIRITGNMKFDIEESVTQAVTADGKLLVAGSTHRGEEEIVLDAYGKLIKEFQNLRLLIAPRHIDRAGDIKRMAKRMGFGALLMSQIFRHCEEAPSLTLRVNSGRRSNLERKGLLCPDLRSGLAMTNKDGNGIVLILDTFGELSRLYSWATIVFMGGSLIKRGGHNIVEPAIFGKPIVFGPFMFNFRDMARSFLEHKAALAVKDGKGLLEALEGLLRDEGKRNLLGANAKSLIDRNRGATERNVLEIAKFYQ